MRGALVALGAALLLATTAAGQAQQRQHRCWDLMVDEPVRPPLRVPPVTDTGALVVEMAHRYIGVPYRYGGQSPKGFDCAGFVRYLYRQFGIDLPSWSSGQHRRGVAVDDRRNLLPGDLVFFGSRTNHTFVGHTGMVVSADPQTGRFRFIHASTSAGVIVSGSEEEYYKTRYIGARRVVGYSSMVSVMKRR